MHETVELIYHTVGAMNERLAFTAYERMSDVLVELGEHGLVDTLMKPLRRDESAHLGYYRTAARDLRDRLDRWQVAVARTVITRTYAPVGAGDRCHKPAFGATIRALGDSDDLVERVQLLAESLLSVEERRLPPLRAAILRQVSGDYYAPAALAPSRRSRMARPKRAKAVP